MTDGHTALHPDSERAESRADRTDRPTNRPSMLFVVDFPENIGRTNRHVKPLTRVADVTMVCIDPPTDVSEVEFRSSPTVGFRPLDLLIMFAVALVEGLRGDYDGVASFSLVPHGCFALAVGTVCRLPTHLGILGIDIDVHATARYGPVVRWLMRRFTVVSVPGSTYARTLHEHGVTPGSTMRLINPIPDVGDEPPADDHDERYDYLWVGRFESEKDPLLFVEALRERAADDPDFSAAMVGDGSLSPAVESALEAYGLTEQVELTGWVDDPMKYYSASRVLVITSERDALPLTLLEGMSVGTACVATSVGNLSDVIHHGVNGLLVSDRTPAGVAEELERLDDETLYEHITANATGVRDRYSTDALILDWEHVLLSMGVLAAPSVRSTERVSPTDRPEWTTVTPVEAADRGGTSSVPDTNGHRLSSETTATNGEVIVESD